MPADTPVDIDSLLAAAAADAGTAPDVPQESPVAPELEAPTAAAPQADMGLAFSRAQAEGTPVTAVLNGGLAGAFDLARFPLREACLVRREIWPEYGLHDGQSVTAEAFGFPLWQPESGEAVRDRLPLPGAEALHVVGARLKDDIFTPCTSLTVAGVSASLARAADLQARYRADLENMPPRLLHPRRVLEGVREGVEHGGNKSGIPTVNGSLVFDERYLGKPLVYCGTVGLIPAEIHGRPGWFKQAEEGDVIVMTGGRIGKDGIHGATFSSEELHEGSPATAVQIGDPITQRKMYDFIMKPCGRCTPKRKWLWTTPSRFRPPVFLPRVRRAILSPVFLPGTFFLRPAGLPARPFPGMEAVTPPIKKDIMHCSPNFLASVVTRKRAGMMASVSICSPTLWAFPL